MQQRRRCNPMTLVSGNIRFIFVGFPGQGASSGSGVVDNSNFQCFAGRVFGNFRNKASIFTRSLS